MRYFIHNKHPMKVASLKDDSSRLFVEVIYNSTNTQLTYNSYTMEHVYSDEYVECTKAEYTKRRAWMLNSNSHYWRFNY